MIPSIAAIISYCTNDYRFLKFCIEGLKPFCKQIIIPVSTHSVSGVLEDAEMLHRSYAEHPDCTFIEFAYDPDSPYGLNQPTLPGTETDLHYWHSSSRYVGWHFVQKAIDYILFVDVDEIFEGARFLKWLSQEGHRGDQALLFSSYHYFREPCYRSTTNTNTSLLLHKESLPPELILNDHERPGIFYQFAGKKRKSIRGIDQRPMVHHYSWVRSKEESLFKVRNWGHRYDRDWNTLVEEEFSGPFQGTEKFCGFRYRTVKPLHPILDRDVQALKRESMFRDLPKSTFPHVTYVTARDIFRINLQRTYGI